MRNLITIVEDKSSDIVDNIKATSWEALPEYLAREYPMLFISNNDWGAHGTGVGGSGYYTRVWPSEFYSNSGNNRWPSESNWDEDNQESLISAIKYVTPSYYKNKVGGDDTKMYFEITVYRDDSGKVTGGEVEVVPSSEVKKQKVEGTPFERKFKAIIGRADRLGGVNFVLRCGELFDRYPTKARSVLPQARKTFVEECLNGENSGIDYGSDHPYMNEYSKYLYKYFFDDSTFQAYLKFLIDTDKEYGISDLMVGHTGKEDHLWNTPEKQSILATTVKKLTGDFGDYLKIGAPVTTNVINVFLQDANIGEIAYLIHEVEGIEYGDDPKVKKYIESLKSKYKTELDELERQNQESHARWEAERVAKQRKQEEEEKRTAEISAKWDQMSPEEKTQYHQDKAKQTSMNSPYRKMTDDEINQIIRKAPTDLFKLPLDMRTFERWVVAASVYPKILDAATAPGLRDKIEAKLNNTGESDLQRIKQLTK